MQSCELEAINITNICNTSNLNQVALDWKDSVSTTPSPSLNAWENLAEELNVIGKSQAAKLPVAVAVNTFAEVSQIAEETVIDATR